MPLDLVRVRMLVPAVLLVGLALSGALLTTCTPPEAAWPDASDMRVRELALKLETYLRESGWRGSTALYKQVHDCQLLSREKLLESSETTGESRCAFAFSEAVCLADWETTGGVWNRCCGEDASGSSMCETAQEAMPELPGTSRLLELYATKQVDC